MSTERLEQAAEWWLRLREPNVTPDVVAEWMLWCEAATENKEAFASIQSLWHQAKSAPLKPVSRAELRGGRWRLPAAIAAGVVLTLLGSLPWIAQWSSRRPGNNVAITTQVGANREIVLPDGSQATLGGATALTIVFEDDRRAVVLNSGEAFFDVHAEPGRPFIVRTPSGSVAAVGTAFDVRTDGRALRVTVANGSVEISTQQEAVLRLHAGQQAVLRSNDTTLTRSVDSHVVTAWTSGTLQFIDEPLDSVIAAVNRYSATRIEIRGGELGNLHYTGTVVSGRIEEWLTALPNVFPLEVVARDSDRIILRPRE